jgi:hypothetical protein
MTTINIPSSADTRAYRNDPTTNYGTEVETSIWSWYGTQYQVSFAKFAGISGTGFPNIPSNSTINSAILWMRIRADTTSLTVSVYTCSADWNESTLTWNNMPGQSASIGSFANMPANTGGWLSLNITSTVQGWNNGTIPNYGLRLVTDQGGSNSGGFATKESANVPYIVVDYVSTIEIGHLEINSYPDNAEIYIDDYLLSYLTPAIIDMPAGMYDLRVHKNGYADYTEIIIITKDFTLYRSVTLPYIVTGTGPIDIKSTPPGAKIYIDNVLQHDINDQPLLTPVMITGILVGDRYVELTFAGYQDWTATVPVVENTILLIDAVLAQTCPGTKYSGDTITLRATPRDGIGPYYVAFKNNGIIIDPSRLGNQPNPILNAPEDVEITRTYTLDDADVRNALTGTIDFSVFIRGSCPTGGPNDCMDTCTIAIGCIAPVCNFVVT